MKYLASLLLVISLIWSCKTPEKTALSNSIEVANVANDTVRIANNEIEYEIIIIDPGFNTWLASTARPRGYYSQSFMENRNIQYVIAYNQRVLQPREYDPMLYEWQIDYQQGIDYGYEVNYLLYNYFIYFQMKYKQQLTSWIPRI